MSRIIYISAFLLFFTATLGAQKVLSADSKISVLTCSDGEELYSAFGHSAIRVSDATNNIDWVFNYGTFDFNTPWFYLKFANGNLDYLLSISEYKHFLAQYFRDNRSVTEQVLNLNLNDRQRLFDALLINYKPENRNYRYDFFYDNCATRITDIVSDNVKSVIVFSPIEPNKRISFRSMLHHYLYSSPWTEMGLAMILGLPADKIPTVRESTFLPYFLMQAFDQATYTTSDGQSMPLIKEKVAILDFPKGLISSIWSPVLFFWLLLILSFVLVFFANINIIRLFDGLLFLSTGIVGVFISFLWFVSNHSVTGNNWNLLWAMPTFLFLAFANHKSKVSVIIMFFNLFCLGVFLIGWKLIPQAFPLATIPMALLLGSRMILLLYRQRKIGI